MCSTFPPTHWHGTDRIQLLQSPKVFPEYVSAQTTLAAEHFQTSAEAEASPKTKVFAHTKLARLQEPGQRKWPPTINGHTWFAPRWHGPHLPCALARERRGQKQTGFPGVNFHSSTPTRSDQIVQSAHVSPWVPQFSYLSVEFCGRKRPLRCVSLRLVVRVLFLSARESRETFQVGGGWLPRSYVGCSI